MGLSASQARLLSLTSRLSNLELQAQSISNSKSRLADEGTAASKAYSDALDKQTMKVYAGVNPDGTSVYKDATANNLTTAGAVSDTDKQRFIKNQSGQLLVSDFVLAAYNNSGGNLENFINGLSYTATSPSAKQQVLETSLTNNLAASVASANSLMTTRTDSVPSGQYTPVLGFSTNYNDSSVFQALNNVNPTAYKASPTASNVIQFYQDGSGNSSNDVDQQAATTALLAEVDGVTSATATAVTSVLQNAFGSSKWSLVADQITTAANRAQKDTENFYKSKEANYVNFSGNAPNNTASATLDANTNDIYNDSYSKNELYIDRSQEIKTFLAFFDQECQNINGNQQISSTGTYSDETNGSITQSANKAYTHTVMQTIQAPVADQITTTTTVGYGQPTTAVTTGPVSGNYGTTTINTTTQVWSAGTSVDHHGGTTNTGDNGTPSGWYPVFTTITTTVEPIMGPVQVPVVVTDYSPVSATDGSTNRPSTGSGTGASNNVIGHDPIMTQVTVSDSNASSVAMEKALQAVSDSLSSITGNFGDVGGISSTKNSLASIISALKNGASVSSQAVAINPLLASIPGTTTLKPAMDKIDITSKFAQYNYDESTASYYEAVFNQLKDNGGFSASDDNMNNSQWLQTQITAGNLYLYENDKTGNTVNVSWTSGDSTLQEETNNNDTAKAEANYQTSMADISAKDNRFDLQLKNIDTEHTAIQTEVASVSKVVEKNIEKSFKMFDA